MYSEELSAEPESTKDISGQSETPDRFGYSGLYDTAIAYIHGREAEFSTGISLKKIPIYPAPSEELYELGYVYPGRTVEIIRTVDVGTYDEEDSLTERTWYLVAAGPDNMIGYIKTEDIEDAETVRVEPTEPWQIRKGGIYYTDRTCTTPMSEEYEIGPLWMQWAHKDEQVWKLTGFSGLTIYVTDPDVLEMFRGLGLPRNGRAG